jgi:antitoxin component YwqK of YwqJK toxin-antitoxin module
MQSFIKRLLLSVLLVLSSVVAHSLETEKYYDNGVLQFKYSYRDGKLDGTTEERYETGELKAEHEYQKGKLIGKTEFRRNGDFKYVLKYEGTKKIETRRKFYPTGERFREWTLVNGKIEGLEIDYYRNGKKKAERHYKNGKRHGSAKGFHINGKEQGDWIFENGEPVFATLFYSTGEKWLIHKDFDSKGRLNGSSKEYDKEGNLVAIRYYVNNDMVKRKRINPWLRWWFILWD